MLAISKRILSLISSHGFQSSGNYQLERNLTDLVHFPGLRFGLKVSNHLIDAGDHSIPVRLFSPRAAEVVPEAQNDLLLFLHGGGWVSGSVRSYDSVCAHMARQTGHRVLSVEYRLAPEHPFPLGLDDATFVFQFLVENAEKLELDPKHIILVGDSAGGNLSAALSQKLRDENSAITPSAQILLYPALDYDHSDSSPYASVHENGDDFVLTNARINEYIELYQSKPEDLESPYFAPIHAQSFANLPPALIISAEYDPLRDEAKLYAQKMEAAGCYVQYHCIKDALHGYLSTTLFIPQTYETYEYINRFLESQRQEYELLAEKASFSGWQQWGEDA